MFNSQLRARLAAGVAGLPDIYRVPVILRDLDGLSTEEASMQLRIKEQTLKSRLHRGRLMLRQQLADVTGGLATRPPNDRRTNVAFTSASLFQT
jgi:RNA polymerase sigma-70 factor (ECF subfamily)